MGLDDHQIHSNGVGINFSWKFFYSQFVMRFVGEDDKAMQRHKVLCGNPILKNHGKEGENSQFLRGYSEFCRVRTLLKS